jgi:hypothetical protein
MRRIITTALGAVGLLLAAAPPAGAQLDYRNLDDGRPLWSEDAWPVERRALEFLLPWSAEFGRSGTVHWSRPELAWGAWDNLMLGAKLPIALLAGVAGRELGIAGPGLFAFYNLRAEGARSPAVALRADGHLPAGAFAAGEGSVTLKGIATRTLGRERLHFNAAWTPIGARAAGGLETEGQWAAAVAIDRTLFRTSTLLAAELVARDGGIGEPARLHVGVGVRRQVSPTLVLDLGASRALQSDAPHPWGITLGISRAIGVGRGGRGAARVPGQTVRAEWHYLPGGFNWEFRRRYPEAAGLFNAFDYGHAVLYERLWTEPDRAPALLETTEFNFLTRDLLVRPPRFAVAEDVVEPTYARVALEAKRMFEWAHLLHRQLYDAFANESLTRVEQHRLVERLTDDYLSRTELAFTDQPKAMELMDDQPFSQYFRRAYPKMNGLIWAYHWLQVGLYEPLLQEPTPAAKKAGVADALSRFWAMADSAPSRFPAVMPMTSAVAPTFSAAHPRAAVIFDNLHMMHDIISDILANPAVPRGEKPALIRAQLAEFRNPRSNLMGMDHWRMMAEMMGGVERMGGVAGRRVSRE